MIPSTFWRMSFLGFCLWASPFLAAPCAAGDPPPAAKAVAQAYGLDGFKNVAAIRYAFNVMAGGKEVRREWIWEPKEDRVTYDGPDAEGKPVEIVYRRAQLERTPAAKTVDPWFINDQYWLLFPLHLVWDRGVEITEDGEQPLAIGEGRAQRLTVRYKGGAGYTPGDVYRLYYGRDYLPIQWVFIKGGTGEPRAATWEGYADAGPLRLSLKHENPAVNFKLWFSDVAVRLAGEDIWLTADTGAPASAEPISPPR